MLSPHFANQNYPMINNRMSWKTSSATNNNDKTLPNGDGGNDIGMRLRNNSTVNKNEIARKKKEEEDLTKKHEEENERFADTIEVFARVFFPLVYMLFNVCYWTIYLHQEHKNEFD